MRPDLRDPRLLLAWAIGQYENAVGRAVSGNVRVHFEAGRITRAEVIDQQTPGDDDGSADAQRSESAWVASMIEREQREQTHGVLDLRMQAGRLTLAKTERCEKPPALLATA